MSKKNFTSKPYSITSNLTQSGFIEQLKLRCEYFNHNADCSCSNSFIIIKEMSPIIYWAHQKCYADGEITEYMKDILDKFKTFELIDFVQIYQNLLITGSSSDLRTWFYANAIAPRHHDDGKWQYTHEFFCHRTWRYLTDSNCISELLHGEKSDWESYCTQSDYLILEMFNQSTKVDFLNDIIRLRSSKPGKYTYVVSSFDIRKTNYFLSLDPILSNFKCLEIGKSAHPYPANTEEVKVVTDKYQIAKYPGNCTICNKTINVGDKFVWTDSNKGKRHFDCKV